MTTLPEGSPPTDAAVPVRRPGFRTVNGGDSAAIVWHEYTHGLSNRLVVHDDGSGAAVERAGGGDGGGLE